MTTTTTYAAKIEDRSLGHLLYALMSGFPLLLLPVLLSLFINLSQRHTQGNALLASHLRWQRYSTIMFLTLLVLGYCLPITWLSLSIYLFGIIWFCHRIIKGWLSLLDGLEV
ncbi:hypothetical protein HRJ35_08930 [Shewanella oneidensis MR-1]|uniref:Predicted membrane protein n=1 Tax=Shewanella oneidensis (strain ATCC 700550 / JCM 31522 / CIP 106686 / LMG 19005 / NCIMB 14063 / MR-1) TaxID=211586 RepID=Q8EH65_SHEON|nr:hypothetical protein [Shewanella oneidensis]AAN54430.1 predicted membrane protein [Shewanella oneidensis MR-1]MDX5996799.1 hypothetical protein [Shewanella oneidensis]MEE2026515.1 hypothetical protein [Shewanella oneidensis]QKG96123.1 hypothetical protein HRJ35_08930 [Shewanella oneidensis MR-1]